MFSPVLIYIYIEYRGIYGSIIASDIADICRRAEEGEEEEEEDDAAAAAAERYHARRGGKTREPELPTARRFFRDELFITLGRGKGQSVDSTRQHRKTLRVPERTSGLLFPRAFFSILLSDRLVSIARPSRL